ncbi:type II toxin-antitoxin system antitoxin SocA domain-containing protein [Cronbergia sp. UHCC 0137]|uniref:Panacea domain-containing protein n=1 Tax=Cronbergia sp. UHCC 0137 TaxID=3110239 RepID=UPI002B1F1B35|nr:type II toxin-antitoxin system antitoxin SocA domain-containing protein [Cronbergia sp. UHCC 0137]MEA5616541.1 type II toxin-antitoxin system antitoxin SocA domain-containing protein [Cronbergia sp. UHCC 0137]
MTNMKVQKLLYYAQSLHLALFDEPLFEDEIQAWRYGPVCPPAYRFYSQFEAEQLPIPDKDSFSQIADDRKDVLEEVWDYFGQHHAYYLSGMTHVEFPWKKARKGLPSQARSTESILLEDMKLLGYDKLEQIEQDNPAYKTSISYLLEQSFKQPAKDPQYVQEEEINDWLTSLLS